MKYIDIDLTQSKVRVPNKTIGKQGESFATGIRFKLQPEYSGWGVFVDIETPNGEKSRVELADVRDNVAIYEVSGEELEYNGRLKLDLVLSNETSISKPFSGEFTIKRAICAENPQEGEIPIILTSDMVARIEKIEKDAERLNYNIVGRLSESEDGQLMFDGAPIGKDVEREIYAEDIKYENPQIAEDSDNLKEAIDELANYTITSVEIMDSSISALFDESHSHTFDEKVLNRFSDKSGILYYSGSPVGGGNSKDVEISVKSNTETEYILTFRVGDKIFDTPNLIGSDGTIGDDGVGISSVTLNEDYTLTITLDNGKNFTTSSIRGEKGEKGDNYVLTDADKEEMISDLIDKIPQNDVSAEDVAYTTEYMPDAKNVKDALDAAGAGFASITESINNIHDNYMKTADANQKIKEALEDAKESGEFKGENGDSVAVRNINHSTEDGGENIVYFTDGNVLSVKNGNTGATGNDGADGEDGVSIVDVSQTIISTEDGGTNKITVTLSDDKTFDFEVKNGSKGSDGEKGETGNSGVYIGEGDMPDDCSVQINPNGTVLRVPTKTSDLENDNGYITKADIPTDESYELIGQTPLTLENGGNIKLIADGEVSYSMTTPTVWNFDNADLTFNNVELSTDEGYYKFTVNAEGSYGFQHNVEFIISGLEIGKNYKFVFDIANRPDNAASRIWNGYIQAYTGVKITGTPMFTHYLKDGTVEFTATDTSVAVRYIVAVNKNTPYVGWIGAFNKMYLNYADMSDELTETYSNSGTFVDVETFKSIPSGIVITTDPVVSVYRKAPTDKTLTQSDIPADAEITGKEIAEIKNYLPLYGKTIVNFGDSIFGQAQPPNNISTFLANKTGATVYNFGFGGCAMTQRGSNNDPFSMCGLSEAIANNDYTVQENTLADASKTFPDYFAASIEKMKNTDFSKVDIATIAYGTNDWNGSVVLDNEENLYDTATIGGALRTSIEILLTAYPNARIFVLSTTWRFWHDDNNVYTEDSDTRTNSIGLKLADYNAKLKEVADEYNIPFVDDYNIGINKFNRLQYFSATDGTHHQIEGRKLIAEHLAGALTS